MKKRKEQQRTPFMQFVQALPDADRERLFAFFSELDRHLILPLGEKRALTADFERAFLYYQDVGVSPEDALCRLAVENLGGFYARPPVAWYVPDDAAKIYPMSMKHGQMAVFRLSVYLKEPVVPELLQLALTFTVKRFPSFATTVKKGFFWHYLDASKRRYAVEPEQDIPCRPLRVAGSGSQSFRVLYFCNRIAVEFFHILTDGTGGMTFLKTLAGEYLRLTGVEFSPCRGVWDTNAPVRASETANEFVRAERTEKASGFVDKPAVQLGGRLSAVRPCQVLHFCMDADSLKNAAKARGATVTAYMLALLFLAGKTATDEQEGEFSVQVPVNMRKFYPSDTVRNFALYCGVRLPVAAVTDADAILPEITAQLEQKASKAAMGDMMYSTERMVSLMRYIPLFIKTPIARVVYGFLGDKIFTNTLSNLGAVELPPEMAAHVDRMDFVLGTALSNRASCAMVTVNGVCVLSVTKMTDDPSFEEALLKLLSHDGVPVRVEGSERYED